MYSLSLRKFSTLAFLYLALFFTTHLANAQPGDREIVNQSIEWFSISSSFKFHRNISLYQEGQFRFADALQPMQMQWRSALDVNLSKHFSIVPLGYVYTWNYRYGKQPASYANNEHRLWEQIVYKHHVGRINFSHRVRLEQRFIQVRSKESNGDVVNHGYDLKTNRLRYRFAATIPLKNKKLDPGTFFVSLYNETFLSWGEGITFHEPDQNRLFAGMGYQFSKMTNLQTGLLYQTLIKANGAKQENNIGIQVMLTHNFDLTRKVD